MTITIVVQANHGWPVDVFAHDKPADASGNRPGTLLERVPAAQTRAFHIHSSRDLYIHEVQPDEIAAASPINTKILRRPDPDLPILFSTARSEIGIRAGTEIEADGCSFEFQIDTVLPAVDMAPGRDHGVLIDADGNPFLAILDTADPIGAGWIAGFHVAPGGCAAARTGGDATPAINPHSLWDLDFRPSCPDPRGMTRIGLPGGNIVWIDIYLLGTDHRNQGTSRYSVEIADGVSLDKLDYETAAAIYAGHGKRLPTYDEFKTAAFGVTEKSSVDRDPKTTGLDPARTSRFGLMQATGNLWVWGTDGDPDDPRPSFFGGSWINGSDAGSRYADLARWPECSGGGLSARGACDHLAPV